MDKEKRFCGNCGHVNENGEENKCTPFWQCCMGEPSKNLLYWKPAEKNTLESKKN